VAWWEIFKMFTIVFQRLHFQNKVDNLCTTKKKDDKISIHVVDHVLAYSSFASILQ
jgi:hypothetical protein